MTTEIHRLPGTFTLPAGWPRVPLGDLTSGLFAQYNGADLLVASGATSPAPAITPWASTTGQASLTALAPKGPNVRWGEAILGGKRHAQPDGASGMVSGALASTYTGPLTITGYLRWAPNSFDTTGLQWIVNTGADGQPLYGMYVDPSTSMLHAASSSSNATLGTTLSVAFPSSTFLPVIACFNGANSYVRAGGNTVTGTLSTAGAMSLVRLFRNAQNTAGLNGRAATFRVYKRALTADEANFTVNEYNTTYGA